MNINHTQLIRLHQLLRDEDWQDDWAGDSDTRRALTSEWRLARHIAAGDEDNRQKYAQNLEDSAESEKRIRVDHTGRYPIELLQNAQDACADAGIRGKAWFRVTDSALLVGNQGVPFDADRIRSLVRLGGTTKKPGDPAHHTIGYKGIGFTSVLDVSDRPQIISRCVAFSLDRELAKDELSRVLNRPVSRAPARYFPFPATPDDWARDVSEVADLRSAGAVTIVRLPFRDSVDPEHVLQLVHEVLTPATLLLMPALDSLDAGEGRCWTRRKGHRIAGAQLHHVQGKGYEPRSWLVAERRVPVSAESIDALDDDVWSGVKDLHVLVGVPWMRGRPAGDADLPPIHVYFPTDDHLGRGILIHGDFFLASNRRHVLAEGAAGDISAAAARGVVELAGDLAETYCAERPESAPDLLRCLASRRDPQGYGQHVSALLDEHLATRRIVRTVQGDVITPSEARVVGVEMPPREHTDFAVMLRSVDRLLAPEYEGAATAWLRELGAESVAVQEVISGLKADEAPNYSRAVLAVAAWWRAETRWSHRHALHNLRLLQSAEGDWHLPGELCEPVEGVPPLPPGLERKAYWPPPDPMAAEFLMREFNVEPLDLRRSLDLVLSATKNGLYGSDDEQHRAVHDFARAVFRKNRSVLEGHVDRGLVPVPVRAWRRGPARGWRAAGEVYFSRDWTGSADLERLYRRFGEHEFLGVDLPQGSRRLAETRAFYNVLGVASEPRRRDQSGTMWQAPPDWRATEEVQAAEGCPDGHPYTGRQFEYKLLDRLPALLGDLKIGEAHALANILSKQRDPYGPDAKIWCLHSAHRSRATRRAIGFQHWLLLSNTWVPVHGDPLRRPLVRPAEAWVDVNGRALEACLAQADVATAAAEKLRLPSATKPTAWAVVDALVTLRDAHPDLALAPADVADGSVLLLHRLEASIGREKPPTEDLPRPLFPALRRGTMTWSECPAVPDVPLPLELPIDILPEGGWIALAGMFDLPRASEQVKISTEPLHAAEAQLPGLGFDDRIQLTALLSDRGADLKAVARRLGRLRVMKCSEIRTTYVVERWTLTHSLGIHLALTDKESGTLFVAEPFRDVARGELARLLANHLGVPEQRETILLSLAQVSGLLPALGIGAAALDEAREAIRRYIRDERPNEGSMVPGVADHQENSIRRHPRADLENDRSYKEIDGNQTEQSEEPSEMIGTARRVAASPTTPQTLGL